MGHSTCSGSILHAALCIVLLLSSWVSLCSVSIFVRALEKEETCVGADGTTGQCPPSTLIIENGELYYGEDIGEKQLMDLAPIADIQATLKKAKHYMETVVWPDEKYKPVVQECKNQHELCAALGALGECENTPAFMNVLCPPVCQSCDTLLVENRCPLDPEAKDAWQHPGDLNKMFERIATHPDIAMIYKPHVVSRPQLLPGDTEETASYKLGPWIITLEDVVTEEEANRLIELGTKEGFERSADIGEPKIDGTFEMVFSENRTSTNAWCQNECYNDTAAKSVMERIQNITNIQESNSEFLQLVRYEEGQYYRQHHDYNGQQIQRQPGVRILTVFLYLNDVIEGGGTNFPKLNITVLPKRGRAVVWPNVLDEDPNVEDSRTDHQALPVVRGIKYGANAWIHQRDFKSPNMNGCA